MLVRIHTNMYIHTNSLSKTSLQYSRIEGSQREREMNLSEFSQERFGDRERDSLRTSKSRVVRTGLTKMPQRYAHAPRQSNMCSYACLYACEIESREKRSDQRCSQCQCALIRDNPMLYVQVCIYAWVHILFMYRYCAHACVIDRVWR
jgi:hypothetical protein